VLIIALHAVLAVLVLCALGIIVGKCMAISQRYQRDELAANSGLDKMGRKQD